MIEDLMRTIARAAAERRPLPPALRELGGPLAVATAERLERGDALHEALVGALDPALADLLAGPRPGTAEAALLVAEWLRMRRADRIAAVARLAHPACGLLVIAATVAVIAWAGPAPHAGWLATAAVLCCGTVLLAGTGRSTLAGRLPGLGDSALHARLAGAYEKAALVARWRLPEERLVPLFGDDLARLAPVLADPGAEPHCRRLAAYHREAETRARGRLWWTVMALGYLIGGCLLLAAAVPAVDGWVSYMTAIE